MTKITKLFAIVLCLALVLGTTAMAAPMTSPTKILGVQDFDSHSLGLGNASTLAGAVHNHSNSTSGDGAEIHNAFRVGAASFRATNSLTDPTNSKYNWISYRIHEVTIAEGNGGKIARLATNTWNRGQIGYLLSNHWTLTESKADNKALVASADFAHISGTNTSIDEAGGIATTFKKSDNAYTHTGSTSAFGLVPTSTPGKVTAGTGYNVPGTSGFGYLSEGEKYLYNVGEYLKFTRVYAPFRLTGATPPEGDEAHNMYYDANQLNCINVFNHHYVRTGDGTIGPDTTKDIQEIVGFNFTNARRNLAQAMDNLRVYELSLNPEHFYVVEQTDGRYTDVKLDEEIKIYFSQPLTDCADMMPTYYKDSDITKTTVITDSQLNVYDADDFKATLSDEIVGDQVQGVLTIKMNQPMRYSETYTITLPARIRNIARVSMPAASNRTITVTTLPTPAYSFSFAEDTSAFTNSYKKFDVNATSLSSRETDSIILIGVYDALGNIQSYSFVSASFSPSSQEALSLSAQVAAGSQVKAYACGGKDQIATLDTYSFSAATPIEIQ